MRRVVAAALVVWLPGGLANAQSSGPAFYRATWWDVASFGVAGGLDLLPTALHLPHGAPSCAPCDPATLPGFDRWVVRQPIRAADVESSLLLAAVGGWTAFAGLRGMTAQQARGNFVVFANVATWTAASSEWVKVLVRRKRPVLYTVDAAAAAGDPDNQKSFPSGHVALAFSAATAYAVISGREHLPHRTRNIALLYAGAVGVSALRITAAKHFPSDVAAGAVLGAGIGWLIPTLRHSIRIP